MKNIQIESIDSHHADSDSSIDARVDGTIDQRGEGIGECFCSNPNYVRNV
jgi:hypothetical protein